MSNANTSGSKFDKRAAALRANLMRRKKAGREIANNAASQEPEGLEADADDAAMCESKNKQDD
tara:strand:- start:64947 stop:65135 length:189 start_codon:yes stop_codon:yes gene_type:complete